MLDTAASSLDKKTPIDVLVTLLVWDAHLAVARLLDSLAGCMAQSAQWRLFILDQGSAAPAAGLLKDFSQRQKGRVALARVEQNIGYPAGHNLLHRLACQHFAPRHLVTINSDLVFHDPRWLDGLVDFMDAHPLFGIAGPTGVIYQREPFERLGWCRVATTEELQSGQFDGISGSVCIMRQSMLDEIGLFDESFTPGYYEDTDLTFRARACGWQVAACPVDHAHQQLGPENSTSFIKREQLAAKYGNFQKRNRNLFVERWLVPEILSIDGLHARSLFPRVYYPTTAGNLDYAI
ncbi:MAG TPA: glycosyltransferase [Phycisphaerae bacterium]|nr:glycosyltransferase [Phycisphaerae bacterium]